LRTGMLKKVGAVVRVELGLRMMADFAGLMVSPVAIWKRWRC